MQAAFSSKRQITKSLSKLAKLTLHIYIAFTSIYTLCEDFMCPCSAICPWHMGRSVHESSLHENNRQWTHLTRSFSIIEKLRFLVVFFSPKAIKCFHVRLCLSFFLPLRLPFVSPHHVISLFLFSSAHLVSPVFSILRANCKTAPFSKRAPLSLPAICSHQHCKSSIPQLYLPHLAWLHFKPELPCVLIKNQAV